MPGRWTMTTRWSMPCASCGRSRRSCTNFRRAITTSAWDEAQDTSRIQHAIVSLLAGAGGNLFLVGDEDQSIYGFRAACPDMLLHFEADHPGAKVLFLEQNYRSTPQIVEAADRFIRQNVSRRDQAHAARPLRRRRPSARSR